MRFNDTDTYNFEIAAAAAGTVSKYRTLDKKFRFKGWTWMYESTEANADNKVDFVIDYTTDGTNFTTLYSNGNPQGLLNTSAPLVGNINTGSGVTDGGAGVVQTPTEAEVAAGAVLRVTVVTAGTGTIPAIQVDVNGLKH